MTEKFPTRRITIRDDQASWLNNHPEISLSGLAQKAIDDYNVRFDIEQEIESIKKSLEWDDSWNADLINCPVCGCSESPSSPIDYQHFEKPEYIDGEDDHKAWSGRGDLVRIPFWGECGHCWYLCIGFHKGNSFIFWKEGDHSKSPME